MPVMSFKVVSHSVIADRQTVEVWADDVLCATIVAGEPGQKSIKVISAHFLGDQGDDIMPSGISTAPVRGTPLPIPTIEIKFDPKPYRIEDGEIIRYPIQ